MTHPAATAAYQPAARARAATAVRSRASVLFTAPREARIVKDIVWLAIVSMALASLALLVGTIDPFVDADLLPMTLGAGLASVTFSLLNHTDRQNGR